MKSKICGVSDLKTLEFLTNYSKPPEFIGFIVNYTKSKRYVELDRLKKLHESDVDIKLEKTEQKIRQEVIELLNISLYTRAEVEKIIKEKYKKLKIEYLIEYEIYIDEMEIKRKNDEITLLLGIQFEQLIINKEVNKNLNRIIKTILKISEKNIKTILSMYFHYKFPDIFPVKVELLKKTPYQ